MKTAFTTCKSGILLLCFALFALQAHSQVETYSVDSFSKVIISPHIAVTFVEGDTESVTIHSSTEPLDILNVEVSGKTLHLYLDDAKTVAKREKLAVDGWYEKRSIYKGTVIQATVTYEVLDELSLRGEEKFECSTTLDQPKFSLTLYGDSEVFLSDVKLDNMTTTIYGESSLEIGSGTIGRQKITAYGETRVNTGGVTSNETKITAYGEGDYQVAVEDRLKVTAYGEATIAYTGTPEIYKGVIIGEATNKKIK